MAYSITNLTADVIAALHGTQNNQIQNYFGMINRAGRQLLQDIDPMETKRVQPISGMVYNEVFDYPVATDLKGNKVIDLFPQVGRYPSDVWQSFYNQEFDLTKGLPWSGDMFTVLYNTGLRSIRINAPFLTAPVTLNTVSVITGNGTWSTSGTASNLQQDNVRYATSGSSLEFNATTGAASIVNSTSSAVNLTSNLNQSTMFVYVYMPSASQFTSVNLQWGSDASDYYSVTTSVTQQNTVFQDGWNLLAFPWLGATVVGTPNVSSITYLKVTCNVTAAQTGIHVNGIASNLGSILNMEYYSKYLFRDAITGAFQENVTDGSNLINLDTDSYNLLFYLVMSFAVQQLQGLDAVFFDSPYFENKYQAGVMKYKNMYPSEIQKPKSIYYAMNKGGYRQWGGRWQG